VTQNRAQCSASSAAVMKERHSLRAASTRSSTVLPSPDFLIGRFPPVPEPDPHRSVTNQPSTSTPAPSPWSPAPPTRPSPPASRPRSPSPGPS
jgi:hypothetical protein